MGAVGRKQECLGNSVRVVASESNSEREHCEDISSVRAAACQSNVRISVAVGRHSNLGATVLGLCGYMRVCVRVPVCSCMCVACEQLYVCVACGRGCVVICGCAVVATSCMRLDVAVFV